MKTPLIRQFEEIESTGSAMAGYTSGLCGVWTPERFSLFAEHLGVDPARITLVNQKHTDAVYVAGAADGGVGVLKPKSEDLFDAQITDVPGLMLCVYTADCVPVVFYDPVRKAIGAAHSGWLGTAMEITAKTVKRMKEEYGCDPENIICCIGPYNHSCCYEVGEDVLERFRENFSETECREVFLKKETAGKYLLDMGKAIGISLGREGVLPGNIHDSGHCTYHTEEFSSWRRTRNKKHQILSYIMLLIG